MAVHHPTSGKKFYFYNKNLPFGHSISCSHFQRVSNAIETIFKWKMGYHANNYLDDFLFVAAKRYVCNQLVQQFLSICEEIQFPVTLEKTFWASNMMIFLGMLLDTVNQVVSVPLEKKQKAMNLLLEVYNSKN